MAFEPKHLNKSRFKLIGIELISVFLTMGIWSFQIGCWLGLALVGWHFFNVGRGGF